MLYLLARLPNSQLDHVHLKYNKLSEISELSLLEGGYLLFIGTTISEQDAEYLKDLLTMLELNRECLFISNHLNWNKGWVLINLNKRLTYRFYLKMNNQGELVKKKLHWLLIRPVNGLSNRIRFLISSLALGHYLQYRCFLYWSISEGFDSTSFKQLFDRQFLLKNDLIEIGTLQFTLLSSYAFQIEQHIPGILNGLQQVNSYHCSINSKHLNRPLLTITGSNNLIYVFDVFSSQFREINQIIAPWFKRLISELKPSQYILKLLPFQIDTEVTYGLHLRRGETFSFDISRTGYFIQIAHAILNNEPCVKFFIATNDRHTLTYISTQLPKDKILSLEKRYLEGADWNKSYLEGSRPNGSSIEALADLWLLSKTKKIYGTQESSFSYIAASWGDITFSPVRSYDIEQIYNTFSSGWSIVTCCMNRHRNLLLNVSSWLQCSKVDEIVIIDWSSDPPLEPQLRQNGLINEKIRCLRVEGQSSWILTWAYNLAIAFARYDKVIKIDCDIYLSSDFIIKNNNFSQLNHNCFYTGNWQKSSQIHLNGQLVIKKRNFLQVNGYNEFLTKYGYDDTDLYCRLEQIGLSKLKIIDSSESQAFMYHRDHTDVDRIRYQTTSSKLSELIEQNRILSTKMPWTNRCAKHLYLVEEDKIYVI